MHDEAWAVKQMEDSGPANLTAQLHYSLKQEGRDGRVKDEKTL